MTELEVSAEQMEILWKLTAMGEPTGHQVIWGDGKPVETLCGLVVRVGREAEIPRAGSGYTAGDFFRWAMSQRKR